MSDIRTCKNPDCRKNYKYDDNSDEDYCSAKCKKQAEKRTVVKWRTLSVSKDTKDKLIILQRDIIIRSVNRVKLSYDEIIETMFKIMESKFDDVALKIMKRRKLIEDKPDSK